MKSNRTATRVSSVRKKCVWGRWASTAALVLVCLGLFVPAASAQSYTLAWDRNADPYTIGYRVYGGLQPGNYIWSADVGNATSTALPPLPGNASYYFIVRGYNAFGEVGPASSEISLDLAPPGTPTSLTATAAGSLVTLSWGAPAAGAGVSQYLVSVGTAAGASDVVDDAGVGTQRSVSGTLAPGRYFARVQAANAFGSGAPTGDVSFTVGGGDQPGSPSALSVSWQGTVATFQWAAGAGASSYVLEAGSASGGSDLGVIRVGAATRHSVDVPPGTYFVRVRSVNAVGMSGPSNELTVRGVGAPLRPTALAATVTASTVTLRWSAPTSGPVPTGYVLEVGSAAGLSNLVVAQLGAQTSYVATTPPAGTYYVRVRALNGRGTSDPSNEIVIRR